jgi:hypothetical protein
MFSCDIARAVSRGRVRLPGQRQGAFQAHSLDHLANGLGSAPDAKTVPALPRALRRPEQDPERR